MTTTTDPGATCNDLSGDSSGGTGFNASIPSNKLTKNITYQNLDESIKKPIVINEQPDDILSITSDDFKEDLSKKFGADLSE